jgi:hypothetical protein
MSPTDLAKGLKRLALLFSTRNAEAAMDAAIGMLQNHQDLRVAADDNNNNNHNINRRQQKQGEKPSIPFNMMSEEDVSKMSNFLFSKAPEGQPSEPIHSLEDDDDDDSSDAKRP